MADPKYADLPGIALDEPDVYETNDLPESEQTSDFYEDPNDSVERIHITPNDAFNKFKGKTVEAAKIDFSDRISRSLRTGYDLRHGEWELVGQGVQETPLQKYQRLQCEMNELLEEVKAIKADDKFDSNVLVSGQQVETAMKKLSDLKLEECLGRNLVSNIMDPQGAQIKKLLTQLEAFKVKVQEEPESHVEGDGVTFQLNYRPEQVKLAQTARVAELEKRLHRLESVLGSTSDKLSRLSTATSKNTLLEAAQQLSATASMLDSAQLDHIEGRLTALTQKMDAIGKKKEELAEDGEKDKMILELYELVKNNENVSKVLPQTIERLKALEALHNKATDFTSTLTQVEAIQSELKGGVENNKALLQGVQESFAMNLDEINKTVISLDSRIKALKKK